MARDGSDPKAKDETLCRYDDCIEGHKVADDSQQITCRTCRDWLGLPEIE